MSALPIHLVTNSNHSANARAHEEEQAQAELRFAESFVVEDAGARAQAEAHMVRLKLREEELHEVHDPVCAERHAAWKAALAARDAVIDPIATARKILGGLVALFDQREKKRQEAEQQALLAEERARAEAEREATIEAAEDAGAGAEEIAALCTAPLVVAPVILGTFGGKSAVSTRMVTKGRVTNPLALLRFAAQPGNECYAALFEVNLGKMNKLIAATDGTVKLPGVDFYEEPASTTRKGGK